MSKLKKIFILIIFLFLYIVSSFNVKGAYAQFACYGDPKTQAYVTNKNNAIHWGVRARYFKKFSNIASIPWNTYWVGPNSSTYMGTLYNNNPVTPGYDTIEWKQACVDPRTAVALSSVSSEQCRNPELGVIYSVSADISCYQPGSDPYNNFPDDFYDGCVGVAYNSNSAWVNWDEKCPNPNLCVWGGVNYGACTDYCGGNTPANNCEWINRTCTSTGCDPTSTKTYAAVCDDPNGPNDDANNRCAPPPPSGRTETAFCQGTAGTDRAAGIKFNWDRIPLRLERDSNPYDIQFRKVGGGDLHEINGIDAATYEFPGNTCTTGPGGCSLPYSTLYEWRIQAHTEPGISGPTDWSSWRTQTTNDCSGKPDLRITGFSFPGGNSAGTTDAVVTVNNNGYKGTGTAFNVRVNNGSGNIETVQTPALAEGDTRNVTIPNIARPDAGSYTATAIVDPLINGVDQINEVNEGNNNATTPYTTTSHISGIIFIDNNPTNGTKDTGEVLFTSSATVRVNGVNYTTTNGTYQSNELNAGTYSASMPTAPLNYTLTTPSSVQTTLGPNRSVNFGLTPQTSTVTVYVYKDYRGNQVVDAIDGDEPYQGATITVIGKGSAGSPYTTDVNGRIRMTNLDPGNSTTTLTIPSGYMMSNNSANSNTFDLPPGGVFNFFITPINNPSCAGGLTATPSTVNPRTGVTSQLRCVNPTSPTGDPLSYTWFSDGTGTVDNVNSAVSTWRSPATTNETVTNPSVTVCYQGTNRCRSYTTTINLISISTITGNVYIDENENGIKDAGESNYTSNITITASPVNGSSSTDTNGAYTISNLTPGSYTISYIDLPSNYRINYPLNGPPPNFTVTVGNQANCNTSIAGYNSAVCTNGSISNLNFGIITNDGPWVQTGGSDIWFNNGYPYTIPSGASCQSYASLLGASGTPGVIYTGVGSDNFGSGQASQNPYNWKVGGISSYSESYGPASLGSPLATSYSYVKNLAISNDTPPTPLTSAHCGAGGIGNCNLSPTLASGIYEASGNLTLSSNYEFPANRNYVILVTGNLRLNGTIDVPGTPDNPGDSTVLFSVQGNIYVGSNVGTSIITSLTPHLEGWFSTDHSFYIEGNNTCPTSDNRLNMEGALVVNASLLGGSFYNLRDLCSGNSNCPVFYIKERPDFSLNAPRFIKNAPRIYKEIAP